MLRDVFTVYLLHQLQVVHSLDWTDYNQICNVTNYGAVGDNSTDNTKAIQAAINDCAPSQLQPSLSLTSNLTSTSQNLVLLPQQFQYSSKNIETVYITGSIFLVSNIVLYIDNNVRLFGSSNKSNETYPQIYTRAAGTMGYQHAALINGGLCESIDYNNSAIGDQCKKWTKLENVSIIGNGNTSIIDGNGHSGWYNSNLDNNDRPNLLDLMWIDNLYITKVLLTNSPFWTLHPLFSNNILIENITILTDGPNTDGIDPDSCSNVLIRNNYISTGDDCIVKLLCFFLF